MRILTFTVLGLFLLCARPSVALASELILFEAEGCSWCQRWHEEIGVIYDKTDEGKILPLRVVNVDHRRPSDLAAIKGVYFTPTFVIWHQGRELGRIRGYPGDEFFFPMVGEVIKKHHLMAPSQNTSHNLPKPNLGACLTAVC